MIHADSLSAEWLLAKTRQYKRDPGLIESMIRALHLLEHLKLSALDFIFKGGTSLVLLMTEPLRFSVDIDIIVSPNLTREELEVFLQQVVKSSAFISMELDKRRSYQPGIPKAHYKFKYRSHVPKIVPGQGQVENPEKEILLDVLFADNPYPALVSKPIASNWVFNEGESLAVTIPCVNSITGDKMVAFAPCTTGVLYGVNKEREIIKQLFDVGNLFELLESVEILRASYYAAAISEIQYRPERSIAGIDSILEDTIATGFILARSEFHPKEDEDSRSKFAELKRGIQQFTHFVFEPGFRLDHAQVASAKAAYLAAYLLTKQPGPLQRFKSDIPVANYMITDQQYNWLNRRLKFVAKGEALFYWSQTLKLMNPFPVEGPRVLADENL